MATNPRISNAAAIEALDALTALLDAGAGAGYIEIRTGSPPSTVETSATGTLLGTLALSDPAFAGAVDLNPGARATANAITDDTAADADGTAGWFRAFNSNSTGIIQGTCGTSSADMILNTVIIVTGNVIEITSWTITLPEGS